jgi:hypothetical protein
MASWTSWFRSLRGEEETDATLRKSARLQDEAQESDKEEESNSDGQQTDDATSASSALPDLSSSMTSSGSANSDGSNVDGSSSGTSTDSPVYLRGRTDLVTLWDFDVQIVLKEDLGVKIFEITDLVTEWMNESFMRQLASIGMSSDEGYSYFNTVILLERTQRLLQVAEFERGLEGTVGDLYTALYKGGALFSRNSTQIPVPLNSVLEIQSNTLKDESSLLDALQKSDAVGLGGNVIDLRTSLSNNDATTAAASSNSGSLQVVIVIAIIVACVAFFFLIFAILWAWRYDKRNRNAYLVTNNKKNAPVGEQSPSSPHTATTSVPTPTAEYPTEIVGGASYYPESVISEDISTALSQYYKSGLAAQHQRNNSGMLNDAASISSMESYGYSLDGYAPSLATNPPPADANVSVLRDPPED